MVVVLLLPAEMAVAAVIVLAGESRVGMRHSLPPACPSDWEQTDETRHVMRGIQAFTVSLSPTPHNPSTLGDSFKPTLPRPLLQVVSGNLVKLINSTVASGSTLLSLRYLVATVVGMSGVMMLAKAATDK